MQRVMPSYEILRAVLLALMMLGAVMLAIAAFQYITAAGTLRNTPALDALVQTLDMENPANAQVVAAYEMRRRQAVQEQYRGMILGGVGLVVLGAGWLGWDIARRRRAKPITSDK